MKKKLGFEYSNAADHDLDVIAEWLEQRSIRKADDVIKAIIAAVEQLQEFPDLGVETDRKGVRRWVVVKAEYKYVIFYRVTGNKIRIARVRSHSQRPLKSVGSLPR